MGIQGLLPQLKPITDKCHISKYAGQRVGVDASVWLHRGTYGCAIELFKGTPTSRHINYCVKLVECLLHYGVVPVLVFDGGSLGAKAQTASKRRAGREEACKAARQAQREVAALEAQLAKPPTGLGARKEDLKAQLAEARKAFEDACQSCVEVTPEHAAQLIARLRELKVEFVVAPYEADAQLAYLAKSGDIRAVLTEDSDLVAFGCPTVLYKFDRNSHEMSELHTERLGEVGAPFSLRGFSPRMFRAMCVLSGVDYLESPRGLGLGTARKLVAQHEDVERVLRALRQSGKVELPDDYAARFQHAMLTFEHQRVYDARAGRLTPLTPLPDALAVSADDLDGIIGADLPPELARGIAEGRINPKTHALFPSTLAHASAAQPRASGGGGWASGGSRPAGGWQGGVSAVRAPAFRPRPSPPIVSPLAAAVRPPPPQPARGADPFDPAASVGFDSLERADAALAPSDDDDGGGGGDDTPLYPPPHKPTAPPLPARPGPSTLAAALGVAPAQPAPAAASAACARQERANPFRANPFLKPAPHKPAPLLSAARAEAGGRDAEGRFGTAQPDARTSTRTAGSACADVATRLEYELELDDGSERAARPSPRARSPRGDDAREERRGSPRGRCGARATAASTPPVPTRPACADEAEAAELDGGEVATSAARAPPERPSAPDAQKRARPTVPCAHCSFENAVGLHVCAACDRLLVKQRTGFATPAAGRRDAPPAASTVGGTAKRKAARHVSTGGEKPKAPKLASAKQSIMGYFARGPT